ATIGNIDFEMRPENVSYEPAAMIQFITDVFKPFSETNGAQVTTLELELHSSSDATPLINILESFFPNVTSLEVSCYDFVASGLFDALAKPIEENGERRWLLPRIEKMAFTAQFSFVPLAKRVLDVVRSRYPLQAFARATEVNVNSPPPTPLRELHIRKCAVPRSEAEELENILGDAVKFEGVVFQD
ncbi:hypothetical protein FRC01_013497, partial [Tulasnella sp. 417]